MARNMSPTSHPSLLSLLLLSLAFRSSLAGRIAIYWGQNTAEGTLSSACDTGNYAYIMISFLNVFGGGQEPSLNLAGHCDPSGVPPGCASLAQEIRSCQHRGVKVMLSIGGGVGNYTLASRDDARAVARYLWDMYLGGEHHSRPLGTAILDGIDFDIEAGDGKHWGELARSLKRLARRRKGERVYLSAAPQCPFPDAFVGQALEEEANSTVALFDYVWVQFYNNPSCSYSAENAEGFEAAWGRWVGGARAARRVFLGLPAAPEAAGSGFVTATNLTGQVLPIVRRSRKYGGVMLWSRYYDEVTNYSTHIKSFV